MIAQGLQFSDAENLANETQTGLNGVAKCRCGGWKLTTFDVKHCQLSSVASLSHSASTIFVCSTFAIMQHVARVCQLILVQNGCRTVVQQ